MKTMALNIDYEESKGGSQGESLAILACTSATGAPFMLRLP